MENSPEVAVYGHENCDKCNVAKATLTRMEIPFTVYYIDDIAVLHEGWRDDYSIQVLASYHRGRETLPVIRIDAECMSYPMAVKQLKKMKRGDS